MDMEKLASIFEAVKVLPLRSSDFVIFRSPVALSLDQQAEAWTALFEALGHSRILILDQGADLEILRRETEPEQEPAAPEPTPAQHRPIDGPAVVVSASPKRGSAPGAIS